MVLTCNAPAKKVWLHLHDKIIKQANENEDTKGLIGF